MWHKSKTNEFKFMSMGLLIAVWLAAYFLLPLLSDFDGPFDAPSFEFGANGLPFMSKTELKVLGFTVFVLESRENLGPDPGTVFVLRNQDGSIRWTRLGAPELGRIRLEDSSARWFLPGGWVIRMKPEYTGDGEIYVSPWGSFRYFFHRW